MSGYRVVENHVNKERVTFLVTTDETEGAYFKARVEMFEGGKVPMHYHLTMTKKFEMVEGNLALIIGKRSMMLQPGDVVEVPPKTAHKFWNNGRNKIVFNVTFTPAGGFEKAVIVGDSLSADGLSNKNGLPKKLLHTAVMIEWAESYTTMIPLFIQWPLFKMLFKIAQRRGIDKMLEERYL